MSKASSRRKSAAPIAAQPSNVVHLPLPDRAEASVKQQLLFADAEAQDPPPWLIDTQVAVQPKQRTRKKAARKTAARPKNSGSTTKAKRPAASRKTAAKAAPVIASPVTTSRAAEAHPIATVSDPIDRAMAPVVWRKAGSLGALAYWLRATGRRVKSVLGTSSADAKPASPAGVGLRPRNDLLRELAVLRQENAAMRAKLGLPAAPLGRLVADRI